MQEDFYNSSHEMKMIQLGKNKTKIVNVNINIYRETPWQKYDTCWCSQIFITTAYFYAHKLQNYIEYKNVLF